MFIGWILLKWVTSQPNFRCRQHECGKRCAKFSSSLMESKLRKRFTSGLWLISVCTNIQKFFYSTRCLLSTRHNSYLIAAMQANRFNQARVFRLCVCFFFNFLFSWMVLFCSDSCYELANYTTSKYIDKENGKNSVVCPAIRQCTDCISYINWSWFMNIYV